MSVSIAALQAEMEAAAAALAFEVARALRDRIALLRAGADDAEVDTSGLTRQQPGAMGLGATGYGVLLGAASWASWTRGRGRPSCGRPDARGSPRWSSPPARRSPATSSSPP